MFVNHGMMASQGTLAIDGTKLQPNIISLPLAGTCAHSQASPWYVANNVSIAPVNGDRKIMVAVCVADYGSASYNVANLVLVSTNGNQTVEKDSMTTYKRSSTSAFMVAMFDHPGTATANLVLNSTQSTVAGGAAVVSASIRNVKKMKVDNESYQFADSGTMYVNNPPGGIIVFASGKPGGAVNDYFSSLTGVTPISIGNSTGNIVTICANTGISNSATISNVSVTYNWVGTSPTKFMWLASFI